MTGRTLFKNCKLLDGENPAITTATIALDGDCIVGAEAEVPQALPGDTVIDLRGLTIMPGMVMSHFHAAYRDNGGPHSMSVNATSASLSFILAPIASG